MLTQRLVQHSDGSADLLIHAEPIGAPELIGLADELNLRSTIRTEGTIHILTNPQDGTTPNIPDVRG